MRRLDQLLGAANCSPTLRFTTLGQVRVGEYPRNDPGRRRCEFRGLEHPEQPAASAATSLQGASTVGYFPA